MLQQKTKKTRRGRRPNGMAKPRIVQLGTIIPSQVEAVVTFQYTFSLINAGGYYYARPFLTNAPYDVDPALGSTDTQGFAELAGLYSRSRVLSYQSDVQVVNAGVFPTMVVVLHRNTNASSAGGSATDLDRYLGNPFAQHKLIGHGYSATGTHVFRASHTISQVVGSPAPLTADSFQSLNTAVPSDVTFIEIGAHVYDPSGASNLTSGVVVNLTLRMRTSFFERKQFVI